MTYPSALHAGRHAVNVLINWNQLQMDVVRSVVDGIVGKCKTETSRRPVPIDQFTADEVAEWKTVTCYAQPEDWVFASEKANGRELKGEKIESTNRPFCGGCRMTAQS